VLASAVIILVVLVNRNTAPCLSDSILGSDA
jgi:hypothetical protein